MPEVAGGLVVTADADGVVARADARGEGGGAVAGGFGVKGHLAAGSGSAGSGQRSEEGRVQAATLAGQEVVVHGLGEQRMPEAVGVSARDEHLVVDGFTQGCVELIGVEPDDLGEHGIGGGSARTCDGAHDKAGFVGETVEPHEHQLGETPGKRTIGETGVEQLLGVEGVAGGPTDDGGRALVAEAGGFT